MRNLQRLTPVLSALLYAVVNIFLMLGLVEPVQNPEALKVAARGDALPATYGGSSLAQPQSKKTVQPTTDGTTNATSMNSRKAVY